MAGEDQVASWLKQLPYKLRRELAGRLKEIADDLAGDIRAAAPQGPSGRLRASIKVARGHNTLELVVLAGGALTTKAIGNRKYARQIDIGAGDDTQGVARGSKDVAYDYALAVEFGNSHIDARPFFFGTYRARRADIERRMNEAVGDIVGKFSRGE